MTHFQWTRISHLIQVHDPVDLELEGEVVAVDRFLDVGLCDTDRLV